MYFDYPNQNTYLTFLWNVFVSFQFNFVEFVIIALITHGQV